MFEKYRQKISDRCRTEITRYVRTRYTMLTVKAEQGMFNHRCHLNCVQWVYDHPERTNLDIVEVMTVEEDMPYVHYLVHDGTAQAYLDVTLGYRTLSCEHYLIRTINRGDYYQIAKELTRSKHKWTDDFTTKFQRWILDGEPIV